MGLDMYLIGERSFSREEHAFPPRVSERFELGRWRNHHVLHRLLLAEFTYGHEDAQEVWLSRENLQQLLDAIANSDEPVDSDDEYGEEDRREDIEILTQAIVWIESHDEDAHRFAVYQASW